MEENTKAVAVMMRLMNITAKEAMDHLAVPEELRSEIEKQVKKTS